jgi:hypothetical protein
VGCKTTLGVIIMIPTSVNNEHVTLASRLWLLEASEEYKTLDFADIILRVSTIA